MRLTITGSADGAGIPVQGCGCTLCRQARAVRHLRRRPTCLSVQDGGEHLLIEAGLADLGRGDWSDAPTAVLLSSWEPPNWTGLVRMHLGKGPALPVFGPQRDASDCWLVRHPGRLQIDARLTPDHETVVGRFRVHPFRISDSSTELGYGISCGEQRLAYIPLSDNMTGKQVASIQQWRPQAVVLGCPSQGRPEQRLEAAARLHRELDQPALLLVGIDHHLDQWLSQYAGPLPDGMRATRDDQRVDMAYLNEYRRLGELAS
jgi:phosphoribosyl 1,2-cyclic phosphate phosphodiesterase